MLKNTPLWAAGVVRTLSGGHRHCVLSLQLHRKSTNENWFRFFRFGETAKLGIEADTPAKIVSAKIPNKG